MTETAGSEYFDAREFEMRASIEDHHYWHVHRRAVLLAELRAHVSPEAAGRLLEIGCGIGTVATHLNANGYVVDYADYFPNAIAIARERATRALGNKAADRRFMQVDATKPIDLSGYGGVMLFDVIEHLPDDVGVLTNARGVLDENAPNAFLMITVPAFQFLWSPWDDVEKHKRRYTKTQAEKVVREAGFEVVRSTYFFSPLFFAALGVKGIRALRTAALGKKNADNIGDLVETQTSDLLNRVVLGAHAPERRWLTGARALPLGTSILVIAKTRPLKARLIAIS